MSSLIAADNLLMWKCPDEWTFAEVATIPAVYATVLHALMIVRRYISIQTFLDFYFTDRKVETR